MIYTPMTMKAMKIAYEAHLGQKDKAGVPYIFHPIHLAEQMTDEISCTVALLHDVIEDSDIKLEELMEIFPSSVIMALELLTHKKDMDYEAYIYGLRDSEIARKVKLVDLEHNSDETRLAGSDVSMEKVLKRRKKYTRAKEILKENKDVSM